MANAWPFTIPRVWDLNNTSATSPTGTRQAIASATTIVLGGIAVTNPSNSDALVIYTDDAGIEIWRFRLGPGMDDSDSKEWTFRTVLGLWVLSTVASVNRNEWGWTGD